MTERKEQKKMVDATVLKRSVVDLMFCDYCTAEHEDGFNALRKVLRILNDIAAESESVERIEQRITIAFTFES